MRVSAWSGDFVVAPIVPIGGGLGDPALVKLRVLLHVALHILPVADAVPQCNVASIASRAPGTHLLFIAEKSRTGLGRMTVIG